MLGRNRRRTLRRLLVFNRRLGRSHGEVVRQFLDIPPVQTVFRIEGVFDDSELAIHILRHAQNVVVIRIGSGGTHERTVIGVVSQFHSAKHGLGQVGRDVEVLHGSNQVVRPFGLRLDELHALQPALSKLQHSVGVLGGKAVTHYQDVGDQPVRDLRVIDLLRSGTLRNRIAHVRIPCDRRIHLFLGEQSGWLNSILSMNGFVENLVALFRTQS